MAVKINITKQELEDLYLEQDFSFDELASHFGCARQTISSYIKKYNIKKRHRTDKLILGQIYHNIQVLSFDKINNIYTGCCQCNDRNVISFTALEIKTKHTKSCGCLGIQTLNVPKKYFEEIPISYINSVKQNAFDRKLDFNLEAPYLWKLFLKQNRKCALSGVEITFYQFSSWKFKKEASASLDRIDSSKGYIEGNVQWVHKDINRIKWTCSDSEFITWCQKVVNYQNTKNLISSDFIYGS